LELLDGLNHLGIVHCNRQQHAKALEFLTSSKDIYSKTLEAKKGNTLPTALQDASTWENVEAKHTHTLFYLAQVYNYLNKPSESSMYCQLTLSRQLLAKTPLPHDWSQNCIGLAFFYTEQGKLRQAEYCLSAAESQLKPATNKKEEQTSEIRANLNRGRGHFYLTWLKMSVHNLDAKDSKDNKTNEELVIFEGLKGKVNEPSNCHLATNFAQAKVIWQKGLKAFTDASEYYVLDGFVSEHIEILQDISALYKELIPFEKDMSNKGKLHKRRITKLEHLIDELNKTIYLQFYQQLTDEVARTYSDLVDLKLQLRDKEMSQKKTFSALKKINDLVLKAIHYYELWLKTFDVKGQEPETLDAAYHKPYFANLFSLARLYSKYFSMNVKEMSEYMAKSLNLYKKVVDKAAQYKTTVFDEELILCKQMIELLPIKIQKMMSSGVPMLE